MPTYNSIEYSDNYSDTSRSLWQFKRDEVPNINADLTVDDSQSVKYKAALVQKMANAANGNSFVKKNSCSIKISEWFLEITRNVTNQLKNSSCIKLDWRLHFIPHSILHVPTVTLSTKDNVNLTKQLGNRFERLVYWNSYQTIPG